MTSRRALLIGVPAPYSAAIAAAARIEGVALSEAREPFAAPLYDVDLALCVLTVRSDPDPALQSLAALRKRRRSVRVVVLAEGTGTDEVVRLIRAGAADVIGLPAAPAEIADRVLQWLHRDGDDTDRDAIVGETASMVALREEIRAAAATTSTVLLSGETGTGKGLVAEAIHRESRRKNAPFVHVDCAALPPSLIESELFGHERGAFTGASTLRRGRFELAASGTILLDEIAELDPPLQAKLLRVLQNERFERIGGTETLAMRARVIAATNQNLAALVQRGRFRADVYFRLNVLHLRIPPLRERLDDLPLLVRAGLARLAARLEIDEPRISGAFLRRLAEHEWPGNVRELFNTLERLVVRGRGTPLEAEALDDLLGEPAQTPDAPGDLLPGDLADRERIAVALRRTGGNVSRAARQLGVGREKLRYRIRKYRLDHLLAKD